MFHILLLFSWYFRVSALTEKNDVVDEDDIKEYQNIYRKDNVLMDVINNFIYILGFWEGKYLQNKMPLKITTRCWWRRNWIYH